MLVVAVIKRALWAIIVGAWKTVVVRAMWTMEVNQTQEVSEWNLARDHCTILAKKKCITNFCFGSKNHLRLN